MRLGPEMIQNGSQIVHFGALCSLAQNWFKTISESSMLTTWAAWPKPASLDHFAGVAQKSFKLPSKSSSLIHSGGLAQKQLQMVLQIVPYDSVDGLATIQVGRIGATHS
jgi:hypothetical protein